MKIVKIDLTGCKYTGQLHDILSAALDFPSWYGRNWSALYDLMSTEVDVDKIIITGENTLPDSMNDDIKMMHKIFDKAAEFHKKLGWSPLFYEVID